MYNYVEGEESELVSCSIVTNTCVVSRYSLLHVVVRKGYLTVIIVCVQLKGEKGKFQ